MNATMAQISAVIAMGTWKKMILKIAPCLRSGGKPVIRYMSRASRIAASDDRGRRESCLA